MSLGLVRSKTCRCCQQTKPAEHFIESRFTADRLTDRCRSCIFDAARRDRAEREARAQRRALTTQGVH